MYKARISRNCKTKANKQKARGKGRKPRRKWKFRNTHIIKKRLEKISYIAINTKTQIITPTEKGELIYDVVRSSMPDMLNPKLTASWEKGLEMVAKKEIQADEFMQKLEGYVKSKINKLVIPRQTRNFAKILDSLQ